MTYFAWIMIAVICFIVVKSLIDFIQGGKSHINMLLKESRFSSEIFYTLLIIYSIVIIGFGLIYFILSFQQIILVEGGELRDVRDRKSTRLNSSHVAISYAVFCLKKKKRWSSD